MIIVAIVSPWLGETWSNLMEKIWVPLLAALFFFEFALVIFLQNEATSLEISLHNEARQWHKEEMAQWLQENGNPGEETNPK